MTPVELCVDVQSPDINVPCPPDPVLNISYPRELPETGSDLIFLMFHIALILILVGVAFVLWRRAGE